MDDPLAREEATRANEARRPKADKLYLAEASSALATDTTDATDGRNLTDVLLNIAEELDAVLLKGGRVREIAIVKTKLEEAWLWAVRHGQLTGSHVIIDRRVFRTDPTQGEPQ